MAGAEKWIPPDNIVDIIYKRKCHKSDIAKDLGISRGYLYELLDKNIDVKTKYEEVEKSLASEWIDAAEKNVWYALSLGSSKPSHALKAAMYVLDRRGKTRGWEGSSMGTDDAAKLEDVFSFYAESRKLLSERNMAESSSSAESKS